MTDMDRLVPPSEAARLLGTHRVTIWRWAHPSVAILPPPIRITSRKVGWRLSTIEKVLADRDPGGAE